MDEISNRNRLTIIIDHVGIPHAVALKKFFESMEVFGGIGASCWCAFMADGDGDFHPHITAFYHDKSLPKSEKKMHRLDFVKDAEIIGIDPDSIAWELYHKEEERKKRIEEQSKEGNEVCCAGS